MTWETISDWSPIEIAPTKNTTPFSGGFLKYLSFDCIDSMADRTFFLVAFDLMLED